MKSRNQNMNISAVQQEGRQIQLLPLGPVFLSGIRGASITGSIDFYEDRQYHLNARTSYLVLSSSRSVIGFSSSANFSEDTQYHIVSKNTHLILSSSAGSRVHVSGTMKVSGTIQWANSTLGDGQGGNIELGDSLTLGAVPFIDFHYGSVRGLEDFNVRLINRADMELHLMMSGAGSTAPQFSFSGSGIMASKSGHLIFSSTLGSIVSFSASQDFGITNRAYHVRAVNSHLVLSSSNGSTIMLSGNLKASGTQHILTGSLDIIAASNPTLAVSTAATATTGQLIQYVSSDGSNRFRILDRATNDEMCLSASGGALRMGINTSTPDDALEVVGDIRATGGFKMIVGPFISRNQTANTRIEMFGPADAEGASNWTGYVVMPYAGSIVGISAMELEIPGTTSAQPVTFSASINSVGVSVNAKLVIGTTKTSGSTTFAKDTYTFEAGACLGVICGTQTGHTTTTDYIAFLTVEM